MKFQSKNNKKFFNCLDKMKMNATVALLLVFMYLDGY